MIRMMTHAVEERLAHVIRRAVEHDRIGVLLQNQFVHGRGIAVCVHLIASVAQGKRQKLGNLRRVVDEQNAAQA